MSIICIKPLDTLFFRTGRPFAMGDETWAECIFPPSPSTLYGAIRSFMIFQREGLKAFEEGKYKEDIGTPEEKGSLKIKGPIIFKDEMFFPAPLDLVKEKTKNELFPLKFLKRPDLFVSDYHLENVLIHKPIKNVDEPEGWFSEVVLLEYLRGESNKYLSISDKDIFMTEPKIGIAREKSTLTSKEGHFYRIPMIRFKDGVSLIAQIDEIEDFPSSGILQLGGESKGARFEVVNGDLFKNLKEINYDFANGYFKIYLATPAIFNKGWIPKWVEENFEGEFNGIKLKLVCCAIGKPIHIGGWDIAKKEPKPLYKAIPPASVYYFKILDNSDGKKVKEVFHLKNISDINSEEGFGLSIVGEVKL